MLILQILPKRTKQRKIWMQKDWFKNQISLTTSALLLDENVYVQLHFVTLQRSLLTPKLLMLNRTRSLTKLETY